MGWEFYCESGDGPRLVRGWSDSRLGGCSVSKRAHSDEVQGGAACVRELLESKQGSRIQGVREKPVMCPASI